MAPEIGYIMSKVHEREEKEKNDSRMKGEDYEKKDVILSQQQLDPALFKSMKLIKQTTSAGFFDLELDFVDMLQVIE